jgi:hypothetical protein
MVPGLSREPLKKIAPDPEVLLRLLHRWRDEAVKAGKEITRISVAYETGRDSFWLATMNHRRTHIPRRQQQLFRVRSTGSSAKNRNGGSNGGPMV